MALCLASKCRGCVVIEREVVYSWLYLPQILSGGSLCGSPVWTSGLEILLCEGGNVELCARTSKHIRVLAIDPLTLILSLSLSLLHCALHHFILLIHILYAWLVCVCLTCV